MKLVNRSEIRNDTYKYIIKLQNGKTFKLVFFLIKCFYFYDYFSCYVPTGMQ